jgi:hypothetical protein
MIARTACQEQKDKMEDLGFGAVAEVPPGACPRVPGDLRLFKGWTQKSRLQEGLMLVVVLSLNPDS